MKRAGERGQSVVETVFVVLLLTLLISGIIQIFLVHNYAFQMANNAYYSLFKHRAYRHNQPSEEFVGFPNYYKKPLRAVRPPKGGRVHTLAGPAVNWSEDDRTSVPMMPFYRESIIEEMERVGITAAPVRLKIGRYRPGMKYLDVKFMFIGAGTKGNDLGAIFRLLGGLFRLTRKFGGDLLNYTGGYTEDTLRHQVGSMRRAQRRQGGVGDGSAAKDQWDELNGDYNHDGYDDFSGVENCRPWESGCR